MIPSACLSPHTPAARCNMQAASEACGARCRPEQGTCSTRCGSATCSCSAWRPMPTGLCSAPTRPLALQRCVLLHPAPAVQPSELPNGLRGRLAAQIWPLHILPQSLGCWAHDACPCCSMFVGNRNSSSRTKVCSCQAPLQTAAGAERSRQHTLRYAMACRGWGAERLTPPGLCAGVGRGI